MRTLSSRLSTKNDEFQSNEMTQTLDSHDYNVQVLARQRNKGAPTINEDILPFADKQDNFFKLIMEPTESKWSINSYLRTPRVIDELEPELEHSPLVRESRQKRTSQNDFPVMRPLQLKSLPFGLEVERTSIF